MEIAVGILCIVCILDAVCIFRLQREVIGMMREVAEIYMHMNAVVAKVNKFIDDVNESKK